MKPGHVLEWPRARGLLLTSSLFAAGLSGCSGADTAPDQGAGGSPSAMSRPDAAGGWATAGSAGGAGSAGSSTSGGSSGSGGLPPADAGARRDGPPSSVQDGGPPVSDARESGVLTSDGAAVLPDGAAPPSNPGVFVAVGYGGRTTRSIDDGRTWIDDTNLAARGGDDNDLLRTVAWGDGKFVALGWRVLTSLDGRAWKAEGGVMSQWIGAVGYAKGSYVAVGGFGLRSTSTDAVAWKAHAIDEIASHAHGGLAYGDALGGRFVATNDNGARSYATDGTDWKYATGAVNVATTAIAYGSGRFVGIGEDQVVISGDGGQTWSVAARLAAPAATLIFADGRFTAIGAGHVFTSIDGASWVDHPVRDIVAGALAYGHGTYVMAIDTSFRRSRDGLTWEATLAVGGNNTYEWIAFGTP